MLTPDDLLWQLTVPTRLGAMPTLDRMRRLLNAIGDPHRDLKVMHVGGTSGKGSTATIAAALLREAGYRVGLHVKPHLERIEERFVVDGAPIDVERLSELLHRVAPAARSVSPTWYELTVAVAFEHFRSEQVDIAVVEVGLGGTYDGTNVVSPLVSVLTNVDLDHTEVLGDTVEKIAMDKVGIIKPGAPTISGALQPTVKAIVSRRCSEVGAPLWQLGREIRFEINALGPDGSSFDLDLPRRRLSHLELRLRGAHQVANAALAVAAVHAMAERQFSVSDDALRRALASVEVPGRLEVVGREPLVLLDGAHNPAKMAALSRALSTLYPDRPITGVLAFKRGHDVEATLEKIVPRLRRAILTRFDAETDFGRGQSVEAETVADLCARIRPDLERYVEVDPHRAVRLALEAAGPRDVVCITGSLYLVGAVRPCFLGTR